MKGLNSKVPLEGQRIQWSYRRSLSLISSRRKWVSLNSLFSLQEIPSSLMNASFKRRKFVMQRQREGFMGEELNEVRTVFERRGLNSKEDVEGNQDFVSQWKGKVLEMWTEMKTGIKTKIHLIHDINQNLSPLLFSSFAVFNAWFQMFYDSLLRNVYMGFSCQFHHLPMNVMIMREKPSLIIFCLHSLSVHYCLSLIFKNIICLWVYHETLILIEIFSVLHHLVSQGICLQDICHGIRPGIRSGSAQQEAEGSCPLLPLISKCFPSPFQAPSSAMFMTCR